MADEATVAPATGGPDFAPPPAEAPTDARSAARALTEARIKAQGEPDKPRDEQPRVNGRFVKTENSAPEGADAAPPQEATGETQESDPAELPPLDLPRSWAKDKAEHWNTLSRDVQEYLIEHDKTSSAELRRGQNEVAEQRKTIEADRTAMQKAREQYEQATNRTVQVLQSEFAKDFGDIKSMADVQKLATDDPFRFAQFQARQMALAQQMSEADRLKQESELEKRTNFEKWSKEQDSIFEKAFPEFADKDKSGPLRSSITAYLTQEVGVPAEILPKLWETDLFRDAMWQRVVYDASRFHAAQQKAKAAVVAPKPAPQRPGVPQSRGDASRESIDEAASKLKTAKGMRAVEAGLDLLRAHRAARR